MSDHSTTTLTDNRSEASGTDVKDLLATKLKVPTIDLSLYLIDEEVATSIPEETARKHMLVPVFKIENTLTLAMADPTNVLAIDEVQAATGLRVDPVQASETGIERTIDQYFGKSGRGPAGDGGEEHIGATSSPGIINTVISRAVKNKASDVHIEPEENAVQVRERVDGILMPLMTLPKEMESSLVTRVKILSKLDISEKRLPQDGRIQLRTEGKDVDIRVSIQPTVTGENVVLRLLDRHSVSIGIDRLGLDESNLSLLDSAIKKPYGMVLVTGPTGSGKTTTLYSVLNRIASSELNVMTIEDPVEYRLAGVRQTQINTTAGYTFANGLRALLRQDPDVIMVGEIRDRETAEIAVRASMTGHLVFSTLHTNDAAGAFTRLIDMGIEPFLVASSLHCVIAQRLVRVVCDKCKRTVQPAAYLLDKLGVKDRPGELSQGKGCRLCHQTGYRGRSGIFEVIPMSASIRTAILARSSTSALKDLAIGAGMQTLRQDGLDKAFQGLTTLEEILRVTVAGQSQE